MSLLLRIRGLFWREVLPWEITPRGFGFAYAQTHYGRMAAAFMPIPLNFVAGWIVKARWVLKRGVAPHARQVEAMRSERAGVLVERYRNALRDIGRFVEYPAQEPGVAYAVQAMVREAFSEKRVGPLPKEAT